MIGASNTNRRTMAGLDNDSILTRTKHTHTCTLALSSAQNITYDSKSNFHTHSKAYSSWCDNIIQIAISCLHFFRFCFCFCENESRRLSFIPAFKRERKKNEQNEAKPPTPHEWVRWVCVEVMCIWRTQDFVNNYEFFTHNHIFQSRFYAAAAVHSLSYLLCSYCFCFAAAAAAAAVAIISFSWSLGSGWICEHRPFCGKWNWNTFAYVHCVRVCLLYWEATAATFTTKYSPWRHTLILSLIW